MIRGLLKLLLLIVVVVAAGAFLLGWWGSEDTRAGVVGTAGDAVQTAGERTAAAAENAREKLGPAAETARNKAEEAAELTRKALAEGSLTAKIKAKMALDDHVNALKLDVDTVGTVVTVSGYVNSQAEKDRALELARDTAGVTQVIDKLSLKR
jgi:osmotically-inducible protein OsmY